MFTPSDTERSSTCQWSIIFILSHVAVGIFPEEVKCLYDLLKWLSISHIISGYIHRNNQLLNSTEYVFDKVILHQLLLSRFSIECTLKKAYFAIASNELENEICEIGATCRGNGVCKPLNWGKRRDSKLCNDYHRLVAIYYLWKHINAAFRVHVLDVIDRFSVTCLVYVLHSEWPNLLLHFFDTCPIKSMYQRVSWNAASQFHLCSTE